MTMELSKDTASEYFANLNPIARKISIDIDETKSTYEHIWNQLSTTEQTDIINETLIRPEIALRYFDNFSTSSSSSSVSLTNEEYTSDEQKLKSCNKLNTKNIYNYDGKSLSTFCGQKTGSRVVHDEVIGIFRDEHSAPLSYKTKSQINLKLFGDSNANCNSNDVHQAIIQLQKYQKITSNKSGNPGKGQNQNELRGYDKIDGGSGKYERFYSDQKDSIIGPNSPAIAGIMAVMMDTTDNEDGKGNFLSKFICKNNLIFNAGTNLILKANQVVGQVNDEEDEGINLIKNINYSGLTSSSSVPSEEEEEKQICEDSKLLLENDELRKGFDFLNNW